MKLSDPFGRMERRHKAGYETMRDALLKGGINTPQAARDVITQSKQRALKFLSIGLAVLLVISFLLPKAVLLFLGLAIFFVVWIATSVFNGKRYIERYINEDLL